MLRALRAIFAPNGPPKPSAPPVPGTELLEQAHAALVRRVAALEAERLELLTEWSKTRDQVIRYMKRVGQLRAREASAEPEDDEAELDQLVMRMRGYNGRE